MALSMQALAAALLLANVQYAEGRVCEVPSSYSEETLKLLVQQNCDRVNRSVAGFEAAEKQGQQLRDENLLVWQERSTAASELCIRAEELLNDSQYLAAAELAVNATGYGLMEGRKCCNLPYPPFCMDTSWSTSTVALLAPFAFLIVLFTVSVVSSWILPHPTKEPEQMVERENSGLRMRSGSRTPRVFGRSRLKKELETAWIEKNCLRVLPGADEFANSASSLFGALQEAFDFQEDNVRNQFEHLLSIWRSQCAMVADRSVEHGTPVNEATLLGEALGDLHVELLDGFLRWREKMAAHDPAGLRLRKEEESPAIGGAQWQHLQNDGSLASAAAVLSTQLAEMATYLMVWGEAGNIRFMPEAIYFITELALAADPEELEELYGSSAGIEHVDVFRSGKFLSKIIRPMYNVIFDEWYQHVDVDQGNQKDKKKLHPGLENFMPPDVANYDDWNELFCDPARMVEGLLLHDGTRLFDLPHDRRFSAIARVDWQVSLEAAETKTHREIHSLWGVYASTHRIWLLHAVLFLVGICLVTGDPPSSADGNEAIMGQDKFERLAAVGLLVPMHALLWGSARWQVTGRILRRQAPVSCLGRSIVKAIWWAIPLVTYAAVRDAARGEASLTMLPLDLCLLVHFAISLVDLAILLLVPSGACDNRCSGASSDNLWSLTKVAFSTRLIRYSFWALVFSLKFLLGLIIFSAMHKAQEELQIALPGRQSLTEIQSIYYSTEWGADILLWFVLWFTTFVLFVSDTQLWFTVVCSVLGVATVFMQRGCRCCKWALEDAVAKIPDRFSKKVFPYSKASADIKTSEQHAQFSPWFPAIWDRILEYMRYEDKIDNHLMGDLSFQTGDSGHHVYWQQLTNPLGKRRKEMAPTATFGLSDGTSSVTGPSYTVTTVTASEPRPAKSSRRIKVPDIFREKTAFEMGVKTYCCMSDPHWPNNPDMQWRILALSRGLGLPMPRPFRAPYFPGLTVCIPHYGESILMLKKELFQGREETVPLMDWLTSKYAEEFLTFSNRMQVKHGGSGWPVAGSQWEDYTEQQWDKISAWASMRMQTLWRTVAGMCLYHPALHCHWEAQADRKSRLAQPGVWDPSDCFTCLVSMQMYKFFDKIQLEHTNRMLHKFPDCLKIAFIDCEDKGITAEIDMVHPKQKRRYFSSLFDKTCPDLSSGQKKAKYRIELPGYPILGDGKGDNQNHAIPFMRGVFAQCIDANQGAYFEQMLLLPCALGEFRSRKRGDGGSKRIVGFPEHITSDIGSIGDFAASAEVAFGTILQRTYAVLGARMHYGHPDIMNKLYMMQQGGVSKATKTVNLSEDIFAGIDFTLRGQNRSIKHSEYFHLAKGRDLGFNTVLGFFSKLSSGTGEQVLTRQAFRMGQVLHLPEALTFYYAHVGYYFTQFLVSWSMPLLVFVWLLVLLSDENRNFDAFLNLGGQPASAEVMAKLVGVWFSWLLALFLVATSLPLVAEVWMERNLKVAFERFLKQMCTMSPLMFIFQAKIIGHYVMNEVRYGGATYVSTGRGLPTDRRPFVGEAVPGSFKLKKVGGLYLDYAAIAYYDGVMLLAGTVLILVAGGVSKAGASAGQLWWIMVCLGLTITSWMWAPFIFNPYQFLYKHFKEDFRSLLAFFLEDSGRHWVEWYDRTQLKPRSGGLHRSMVDITFVIAVFFLAAWYATVNLKIQALTVAYASLQDWAQALHAVMLLPPIASSLVYCSLVVLCETLVGCSSILRRRLLRPKRSHAKTLRFGTMATTPLEAAPGEAPQAEDVEGGEVASTSDAEDVGDEEEAPHATAVDREVAPAPATTPGLAHATTNGFEVASHQCCEMGIPLAFSAFIVTVIDIAEAIFVLRIFWEVGWHNGFIAGFILKWALLVMCIFFGEGLLRARCCMVLGCCGMPLQLWVRAHRMARDVVVSSIIFTVMVPIVFLNSLNEYLCPGCSAHQLLIYRDPGHLARTEAVVLDILGEADDDWGLDLEADGEPAPLVPPVPAEMD